MHENQESTSDSPRKYAYPGQILKQNQISFNSNNGNTLGSSMLHPNSRQNSQQPNQQILTSIDPQQKLQAIASQKSAPKLQLRIKNGNSEHYNEVLKINPLGLSGSQRCSEDGFVFFGTLKHSMPEQNGKITVLNDFVLPSFQFPQGSSNAPVNGSPNEGIKSNYSNRMSSGLKGGCHRLT